MKKINSKAHQNQKLRIPVVGDDAVVDDAELDIRGRGVGVRVVVGGLAMGSPAGVGDAQVARQLLIKVKGLLAHLLAEDGDLERWPGKEGKGL